MGNQWYSKSFRRCLVDMHLPDWNNEFLSKLDPADYANMMALSGVDTAIIYADSCLGVSIWPTRHGYMHKQLKGKDVLKDLISACREKGLNVVVYTNIWSRWAYDTYPAWRIVLPNGKGTVEDGWRYGLCCHNTGYHDHVLKMIEELCSNYDADGLWVDMIGWFSKICYCHGCRSRFLAETGKEIPREVDWDNSDWNLFLRRRADWLAEFAEAVSSTAKKAKLGISVALQCASMISGWRGGGSLRFTQQSDYLAGDFYGDALEQSHVCKLLNSLSKDHPIEFMVPRCVNLAHHTTGKSYDQLLIQAYASIANNACFVLIDAIDPCGTMDDNFYKQAQSLFRETRKYEGYLDANSKLMADVAVYYSFESNLELEFNKKSTLDISYAKVYNLRIRNIVETLVKYHIPFTLITEKNLAELADYQAVILCDVAVMDQQEVEAFKKYVGDGGNMYASMRTSLYDKSGHRHEDFQLADVFGVSYTGKNTAENITYMSPAGESPLSPSCSVKYPLMLEREQLIVKTKAGAETLACLTLPYTNPDDTTLFASANSNPPGVYTKHPALTRNKYGKGNVIYSAGDIESMRYDKHRNVYVNIIKSLLPQKMVFETNAPKPVEITVFKQEKKTRLVINILNSQTDLPAIPVHGMVVRIACDGFTPLRLLSVPEGAETGYSMLRHVTLEFVNDTLDMFRMFILDYQ